MASPYDVIDADGHALEPLSLWEGYFDDQGFNDSSLKTRPIRTPTASSPARHT
jgi:hypothetical protein